MKTVFLLMLPAFALAQFTKGTVKDSLTEKPIPYVSIWIENQDVSTMADSLGQYAIRTTNAEKTLVFSAAGYYPKRVRLPETRGLKLRPIPQSEKLATTIGQKTVQLGSDYKIRQSDLTFGSTGRPWMLARKFDSSVGEELMLNSIQLYTNCHNNNMKLGLRFFAIGEDGKPGLELLDELVIFRVDLGRENTTVDLSKYKMPMPKSGLFVAVTWLIIDQNVKKWYDKRPMRYKDYDPGVGVMPSDTNSSWEYSAGRWAPLPKFPAEYDMRSFRGKYAEVAMKLTLSN